MTPLKCAECKQTVVVKIMGILRWRMVVPKSLGKCRLYASGAMHCRSQRWCHSGMCHTRAEAVAQWNRMQGAEHGGGASK